MVNRSPPVVGLAGCFVVDEFNALVEEGSGIPVTVPEDRPGSHNQLI